MKRRTERQAFMGAIVLLASIAAAASAQEQIDRSLPAPGDGTVVVSNISGSIRVLGWNETKVQVTGTLGRGTERLDFENEGRRTLIKVVLPRQSRHVDGSDLEIRVPRGSRVEVETVSASIEASGIEGELDLQAVSGDVTATGSPREIRAQTVSGTLALSADCDVVVAESVSGDVTVEQAGDEVEVTTVSGRATVHVGAIGRVRLTSVSGDVDFEGSPAAEASLQLESHSGDVYLLLPSQVDAEFDISTFSGEIRNGFGPKSRRTSKYAPGRELNFTTGDGGARIEISSFSGDIEIRTR